MELANPTPLFDEGLRDWLQNRLVRLEQAMAKLHLTECDHVYSGGLAFQTKASGL